MATFFEEMQTLATELVGAGADFNMSSTTHPINILKRTVDSAGATDLDEATISWPATRVNAAWRGTHAQRDGETLHQAADRVVTIEAKSVTRPELDDRIEIFGTEHSIVEVIETPHDNISKAAYIVYVKR